MNMYLNQYLPVLLLVGLLGPGMVAHATVTPSPARSVALDTTFDVMRQAFQQALQLRFGEALETATRLEDNQEPTPASGLTRGIIAYLQARWQTPLTTSVYSQGHEALQQVLEQGRKQRSTVTQKADTHLFIGLAAIFDALLLQSDSVWESLSLFKQGQTTLQQVLVSHEAMADAHLGLGLLYFSASPFPAILQPLFGAQHRQGSAAETIHHLQRAAETGRFGAELAQTFLARVYEMEQQYEAAVRQSQALQQLFPMNGYYPLIAGRSQCASSQYAACAGTLETLLHQVEAGQVSLGNRDDRFDMYYFLARARLETERYDEAFQAFRQAINEDPHVLKDETLWAKYHLATLYERRGQVTTARQMYSRLLKARNIDDLHQQAQQRLTRLR